MGHALAEPTPAFLQAEHVLASGVVGDGLDDQPAVLVTDDLREQVPSPLVRPVALGLVVVLQNPGSLRYGSFGCVHLGSWFMVAGAGFEPATTRLWASYATSLHYPTIMLQVALH